MDDFASADGRVLTATPARRPLRRQVASFVGVGLIATGVHYAVLVALVQLGHVAPVRAALIGFVFGGLVSYSLNRKHTFASQRPHQEAVWRFVFVSSIAFGLTYLFMRVMVDNWSVPYLLAQVITTGLVMIWNFSANRLWTFAER